MRKVIGALNMTLNGNFDHTAGIPDEELHQHYSELLSEADNVLYGRKTFELMKYWKEFVENPTGNDAENHFAKVIDSIPKVVFSESLKNLDWETARLSHQTLEDEVAELKKKHGRNILVGSRSLIIQLLQLDLLDEFQLCIHPVLEGKGMQLFENWSQKKMLKLIQVKTLQSGAIILYYQAKIQNFK